MLRFNFTRDKQDQVRIQSKVRFVPTNSHRNTLIDKFLIFDWKTQKQFWILKLYRILKLNRKIIKL